MPLLDPQFDCHWNCNKNLVLFLLLVLHPLHHKKICMDLLNFGKCTICVDWSHILALLIYSAMCCFVSSRHCTTSPAAYRYCMKKTLCFLIHLRKAWCVCLETDFHLVLLTCSHANDATILPALTKRCSNKKWFNGIEGWFWRHTLHSNDKKVKR